jgi:meso-butanediol dehydrogenase / (S,S)-butanediol dehydrogenase / diacetyl reductase
MKEFEGRLVLVTGAARGLGHAIAAGFLASGARVIACDLDFTGSEFADASAQSEALDVVSMDVSEQQQLAKLAEEMRKKHGDVDILVNNAGIAGRARFDEPESPETFSRIMNVNIQGSFNVTFAFVEQLKRTRGAIVNMSSVAGFVSGASSAGYVTSKGAMRSFTQVLARDLAPFGVRVNAVAPGMMSTEMALRQQSSSAGAAWFLDRAMMHRMGEPDEIVGPVLFLSSPRSSFITGVTLPVDGGFLAQ